MSEPTVEQLIEAAKEKWEQPWYLAVMFVVAADGMAIDMWRLSVTPRKDGARLTMFAPTLSELMGKVEASDG